MRTIISGIEVEGSAAEIHELIRLQSNIEDLQEQLHQSMRAHIEQQTSGQCGNTLCYCDGSCNNEGKSQGVLGWTRQQQRLQVLPHLYTQLRDTDDH